MERVMTRPTRLPPLPPRAPDVLGTLPEPFRPSQVDALPGSVCWYDGSWLVSTDAWQDRRLGLLDGRSGAWRELDAPPGWTRLPMTTPCGELAVLVHERNADQGRLLALRSGCWQVVAENVAVGSVTDWDGVRFAQRDPHGHATALTAAGRRIRVEDHHGQPHLVLAGADTVIPLPKGATVTQLAPSPGRDLMVAVVRRGSAYQAHVFSMHTGRPVSPTSFREPVHGRPTWLDDDRIVLVVERWPSLVPIVWSWRRGLCEDPWAARLTATVRSVAVAPDGTCATALSTPWTARHLRPLDALDDSAASIQDREVRRVVVVRAGQQLPCLVYEPPGARRGTVCYFPGGPHEPFWGEHSAFSEAMNDDGWRVVRVNVRSSGLREERFRPGGPLRYGVDDVRDAIAVIEALGEGPVVTMGMSYGGYIAAMAGEPSDRVRGVAVLSGFLSRRDLDRTGHPAVRRFTAEAFTAVPPEPAQFTKPVFVAHGSADPRVPIDAVRAHARRASGGFTFLELTGQGHAILSDHDARLTYPRLLAWLRDVASPPPRRRTPDTSPHRGEDRERLPT
jgi:pimeloyl-ACP methyl ester carboxylesterase